jgi:hypothetical protein
MAFDLLRTGQVEALLPDWSMTLGGLYFVTPTARARSAKVEALSSFLTELCRSPIGMSIHQAVGRPGERHGAESCLTLIAPSDLCAAQIFALGLVQAVRVD